MSRGCIIGEIAQRLPLSKLCHQIRLTSNNERVGKEFNFRVVSHDMQFANASSNELLNVANKVALDLGCSNHGLVWWIFVSFLSVLNCCFLDRTKQRMLWRLVFYRESYHRLQYSYAVVRC